ncbi:MAG: hypothetical protein H0W76_23690 [Pyrinomonadaceae bacterium]|nr:hypothetical protein [Pyrinomonadaceae bacterium]
MRELLRTAWVWMVMVSLCAGALAQSGVRNGGSQTARSNDGSQLEVKKDEFSGATIVRLKEFPVAVAADHVFKLTMETKVNDTSPAARMLSHEPKAALVFTSQSVKGQDFGDRELHFLIDGKPLRASVAAESIALQSEDPRLRVTSRLHAVMTLEKLRRVAAAREVKMRLGLFETELTSDVRAAMRAFLSAVDAAVQKAPSKERD